MNLKIFKSGKGRDPSPTAFKTRRGQMVDKKEEVKIIQTILDLDFDSISINSTISNLWIRVAKKLPYIMLENTMIPSIYAPTHSIGTNILLSPK